MSSPAEHILLVHQWLGIVEGRDLLVRFYADGTMTGEVKGPNSREIPLESEAVA